jgi:hypothetical protein
MKPSQPSFIDAAKAEDLDSLLDHIAWADTVRPALLRTRDALTQQLVDSTLGLPVQTKTLTGTIEITREQLAGKIYGINYIMTLFEKLLSKGEVAAKQLKELGINIS